MKSSLTSFLLVFVVLVFARSPISADQSGGRYASIYTTRMLSNSDRDGNGFIDESEAGRQWRSLKSGDSNGDGKLSREEIEKLPIRYLESEGEKKLNVLYKKTEEEDLYLDIYFPKGVRKANLPVVFYTHGGGWAAGSKQGISKAVYLPLLERGFCVVSVNYRRYTKGGTVAIRDCVIDCKDAVRFMSKNAAEYGIDPMRCFVQGDSAGGQIAQMLLLASPESLPGDPTLADAKYQFVAGVSWYGPCDFEKIELFNHNDRPDFRDRFGPRILKPGTPPEKILELYREMSPIQYLKKDSPPLLMIQGDQDTTIPVKHAYHMQKKAEEIGAPVEIMIVEDAGHNWREAEPGIAIEPTRDEVEARTVAFMASHRGDEANEASRLEETLPPLADGKVPKSVDELWAGFDPQAEPLDVEILKEWEEDGVVLKVLRYRAGVFRGKKAMIAAVYGYPKGGANLPGLVQIHGGGQYADYKAVLTNAKRGYATVSISWAGRISAPDYRVSPNEVQLFWDNKTADPAYKVTTDWGALDGYHAPSRNPANQFPGIPTGDWTLDEVKSPRNNSWFLCALAARRALTFLEKQPPVDPGKLGVYGHSMGGKLTVLTAGSDDRVKASAPSCGGISDRYNDDPLFAATIQDDVYLKRIDDPVIFLSPANDFHGRINDLQTALTEIKTDVWRVTCAPHHNHQDTAGYEVATQLWFDEHLKGTFRLPKTPDGKVSLKTENGVPSIAVRADAAMPIVAVDIYYSQQGQIDGEKDNMENTRNRFWHHAATVKSDGVWAADLPISRIDSPLWVYANVRYSLVESITGAGYYYGVYTADQFNLSSPMAMFTPDELKAAGVMATLRSSNVIESFEGGWKKQWFTYRSNEWPIKTHKVYDPVWAAPPGAKLMFKVQSKSPNKFLVGIDQHVAEVELEGGSEWQDVTLSPADFSNAEGEALDDWAGIKELRFGHQENLRGGRGKESVKVGADWKGDSPKFQNLRWQP